MNCQATGTGTGTWDLGLGPGKWEIENSPVPGDDSKTPGATHPPTTTQLLTMKEQPDNKVPLVRMS